MGKVRVKDLLSVQEAADLLGIERAGVHFLIKNGHFPDHLYKNVMMGKQPAIIIHPRAVLHRLEMIKEEDWPEWYRVQREAGGEIWLPTETNMKLHRGLHDGSESRRTIPRVGVITKLQNGQSIDGDAEPVEAPETDNSPKKTVAISELKEEPGESLSELKRRLEKVKLEKAEQELALAKNRLIEWERVSELLLSVAVEIRQAVLSVPPRCGPVLAAEVDMQRAINYLDAELRNCLESLSRVDRFLVDTKPQGD
jgi:hypothetical protein